MAVVELVEADQAPLLARRYYSSGDAGPIVAALAQVPEVLDVAMPFLSVVLGPSSIPIRVKELVILRTSEVSRCRFCVDAHSAAALDLGLTGDEVRALRGDRGIDLVFTDPSERALLEWVDAVAGSRGALHSCVDLLKCHVPDYQVVELTLLIGATMMLNRFCTALELPTAPSTSARLAAAGIT
ncbi:MAG TPA: carboxymuconolactone decarboxylase family protein [Acidimicrobiales bacterium]|nr:carboxymuconolactone decarboxylase family protein [Acidimicrobiales bacterium]